MPSSGDHGVQTPGNRGPWGPSGGWHVPASVSSATASNSWKEAEEVGEGGGGVAEGLLGIRRMLIGCFCANLATLLSTNQAT